MATKPKTGLTKKHWFGYMFGDWGGCMTFALMASIFSIYCTNVLGVNATVMGVLTIIWTIWDAVNDPMMGALMDKAFAKHQNTKGKFRPWLLRATPLLAVSAIALWTVPTFLDGIPLLVALFSFKILYEGSYHVQYPHGLSAVRHVHQRCRARLPVLCPRRRFHDRQHDPRHGGSCDHRHVR